MLLSIICAIIVFLLINTIGIYFIFVVPGIKKKFPPLNRPPKKKVELYFFQLYFYFLINQS